MTRAEEMIAQARQRAGTGRSGFRERGPMAELLLERGLSVELTRTAVHQFTRFLLPEMLVVVGQECVDAWEVDCERAINRHG